MSKFVGDQVDYQVLEAPSPSSASSSSDPEHPENETANANQEAHFQINPSFMMLPGSAVEESLLNFQHVLNWNPTTVKPEPLSPNAIRRVQVEINENVKNPIDGIYVVVDESNMAMVHALIVGPKETPYEGGFFYFFVRIPSNYPWDPPKVKLMTTGNGKVRFNPNLYNNGKVCLSILGTWPGPSWTAALTIRSVLLSIQSIMNKAPFFNEPAYEGKEACVNFQDMSKEYSANILYQTIRVAVLDMVEASLSLSPSSDDTSRCSGSGLEAVNMPEALKEKVKELFKENTSYYNQVITDNLSSSKYDYKSLLKRLDKLLEVVPVEEKGGPGISGKMK